MRSGSFIACWLLLALGSCWLSATAEAQDWAATFRPESLAERFARTTRFLVVAAGPESGAASAALVEGLRSAGFPLVMTAESLGDVAQLDDAAILERAAALPGDAILIARVFPGATPETPSVVVVGYDRAGKARGSLNAVAGEALSSTEPRPAKPTEPVDRMAEGQRQYERRFVWFGQRTANIGEGAALGGRNPVRGVERKRLDWEEFYNAVERPDLAAQYARRFRTKKALIISGASMLVTGVVSAILTGSCRDNHYADVVESRDDPLVPPPCKGVAVLAGVSGGLGVGLVIAAIGTSKQPVSREDTRRLAEEYNARLRKELRLPKQFERLQATTRQRLQLSLRIAPSGVGATLRF